MAREVEQLLSRQDGFEQVSELSNNKEGMEERPKTFFIDLKRLTYGCLTCGTPRSCSVISIDV